MIAKELQTDIPASEEEGPPDCTKANKHRNRNNTVWECMNGARKRILKLAEHRELADRELSTATGALTFGDDCVEQVVLNPETEAPCPLLRCGCGKIPTGEPMRKMQDDARSAELREMVLSRTPLTEFETKIYNDTFFQQEDKEVFARDKNDRPFLSFIARPKLKWKH